MEVISLFYRKETKVRVCTLAKGIVLWGRSRNLNASLLATTFASSFHLLLVGAAIDCTWRSNDSGQHKSLLCHKSKPIRTNKLALI